MELTSWWQVHKVTLNIPLLWLDRVVYPSVVNSSWLPIDVHYHDLINVPVWCRSPVRISHLCHSQGDSIEVVLNPHIFAKFVILRGSIIHVQITWSGLVKALVAHCGENFEADVIVDSFVNWHAAEFVIKNRNDRAGFDKGTLLGVTNYDSLITVAGEI